ncbi:MAG: ABC transporter permease [Vicinamibacterales bacterium]
MKPIIALAIKDLRVLTRVRAGLFFTFVWPVVVAVLFGYVFAGPAREGGTRAPTVAVVDEDHTPASAAFVERLAASGDLDVERATRAEAEDAVRHGRRSAYVAILPGFGDASEQIFYGPPRHLELGIDPARQAEAGLIEGMLFKQAMVGIQQFFTKSDRSRRMVDRALSHLQDAPEGAGTSSLRRFLGELDTFLGAPATGDPGGAGPGAWDPLEVTRVDVARPSAGGPSNAFEITFPQGVVWGIIGCVMTFAVGLVTERVRGTFVRLQVAPFGRTGILAGKALACFAALMLIEIGLFALGALAFGVRPGSWLLLGAAGVSSALAFVGFMMMIAGLGRTEQGVGGAGWALLMPMAMFGGAMIPQFVMPEWMLTVGYASPIRWAVLAMEGAVWRGFTAADMVLPCAILLGFGALCFAIGVRGLTDPARVAG